MFTWKSNWQHWSVGRDSAPSRHSVTGLGKSMLSLMHGFQGHPGTVSGSQTGRECWLLHGRFSWGGVHHFCPHPFSAFLTRLKSPAGSQFPWSHHKNSVTWPHILAGEAGKTAVNSGGKLASSIIHPESHTHMQIDMQVCVDLQVTFSSFRALVESKTQRMGATIGRHMCVLF